MNDLFSGSFSRFRSEGSPGHIPLSNTNGGGGDGGGVNLDKFFEDVEGVKDDLGELEKLYSNLHNAKSVKDLRSRMDRDVSSALKKAEVIKVRLEALDRANAANRNLPGCGPGSSSDRMRTSVVNGLRKKLHDSMESFNSLRQQIAGEYKEIVQRRYFTVTGEKADESTIENLIATGESENFLQKAIQEQGRGKVMEIQERQEGVKEIERSMAEMVDAQGGKINGIESEMNRARASVKGGTEQLTVAKKTRKCNCFFRLCCCCCCF